jgi:hypothetical protein
MSLTKCDIQRQKNRTRTKKAGKIKQIYHIHVISISQTKVKRMKSEPRQSCI